MTHSIIFVRDGDFSWRAREVLREVGDRPHLLVRVDVTGPYFPERDSPPFVRFTIGRRHITALMTEIATDGHHLRAYFAADVNPQGRIEFGYASQVLGSLEVAGGQVDRLDEALIDEPFVRVTAAEPGAFAAQLG